MDGAPAPEALDPLVARGGEAHEHAELDRLTGLFGDGVVSIDNPRPTHADLTDDAILRYLAGNLYTGHGAHSIFMKTWAAGLAYSNGLRPSIRSGRLRYYAERTPELPQTLTFVIKELERATTTEKDLQLAEYAIAQAFTSRVALVSS